MLQDLKTIFDGAKRRWQDLGRPQAGRGDFLLSTALFALFDHLGSFMGNVDDSLSPRENISRWARRLESTKRVDLIAGHFGRNALVHRAWPQTIALMNRWSWAFGLNVTANPDESDHLGLYWREYSFPDKAGGATTIPVLKLRMNVGVLRQEVEALITENHFADSVRPETFKRVRDIAIRCGEDPFLNPESLLGGKGLGKNWARAVEEQIRDQRRRAAIV